MLEIVGPILSSPPIVGRGSRLTSEIPPNQQFFDHSSQRFDEIEGIVMTGVEDESGESRKEREEDKLVRRRGSCDFETAEVDFS